MKQTGKMAKYLVSGPVFFFFLKIFSYFMWCRFFYLQLALRYIIKPDVKFRFTVRSLYLVRLLSQCWITSVHTIHPPIEGLLPPTSIVPTPFRNLAFKVALLQVSFWPIYDPKKIFPWILTLLDVTHCWTLLLYAISRKTNEPYLRK